MISAFGVEHGEIEKAFGIGALGSAIGRKTAQAGAGLHGAGMQGMRRVATAGRQMPAGPGKNAFMRGGRASAGMNMRMGGSLQRLGQGMQKRPGLTGGLAVGGAGAAAGGGGYAMNRKKY